MCTTAHTPAVLCTIFLCRPRTPTHTVCSCTMVGKEFLDIFRSVQGNTNLSVDDFADRLNLFTVVLLVISTLFISVKQYVFNSISCYIPVQPSGSDFNKYLSDFCWVHGTIPLRPDEAMPNTEDLWNKYDEFRRISKQSYSFKCIQGRY